MVSSFTLLAGLMLGQTADIPNSAQLYPNQSKLVQAQVQAAPAQKQAPPKVETPGAESIVIDSAPASPPSRPILSKIRGWFKRGNDTTVVPSTQPATPSV